MTKTQRFFGGLLSSILVFNFLLGFGASSVEILLALVCLAFLWPAWKVGE